MMLDLAAKIHCARDKIIEEMKPVEHIDYVQYSPMKRHAKVRFRLSIATGKEISSPGRIC